MNKKKIFVACDSINISKIKEIIRKTKNPKLEVGYKVGLETGGIMSNKRYYLSNKPLTFKQATAQKKAVSTNEGKTCPKARKSVYAVMIRVNFK